ncbi:MAG: DUF131 domain-containing protein [Candidatus Aenigmatarchaeota archaeon]
MRSELILIGSFLIFIGFILIFFGTISERKVKAEGGFILWIGPFPIFGGTDKSIVYLLLILSGMFILSILLLNLLIR